jgi:uncharacterized damage-inducible protein DinB
MDPFPLLARFNAWVNRRLYDAVAKLPPAVYHAERGLFFGSIHRTLNHLLVVDRLWAGRFEGVNRGIVSLDQIIADDLASLRRARDDEDARLIRLVDTMPIERLAEAVEYTRIIGKGQEEIRRGHILMTLFNHQTHHRGQVSAALTQDGIEHPPLDLVFFLDELSEAGPPGTIRD